MKDSLFNEKRLVFMTPPEGPKGPEQAPKSRIEEAAGEFGKQMKEKIAELKYKHTVKLPEQLKNQSKKDPENKKLQELKKEAANIAKKLENVKIPTEMVTLNLSKLPQPKGKVDLNTQKVDLNTQKVGPIKSDVKTLNVTLDTTKPPTPTEWIKEDAAPTPKEPKEQKTPEAPKITQPKVDIKISEMPRVKMPKPKTLEEVLEKPEK